MTLHEADVIVLGAGAAGMVAALNARGRRVLMITPDHGDGATTASALAQGGIAAAVSPGDSAELHLEDTLQAAQFGMNIAAARLLCQHAPDAIAYLESLGVCFSRDGGDWSLHREAAHSRARVLHVSDATGAAIMFALQRAVAASGHIEVASRMRAVGLLRNADGVCGVSALTEEGKSSVFQARTTVIATGGVGGLFSRSTNPVGACGDGVAIALAAGAACNALEFVQFHPTALDVDERPLPLLTEALRGAGARLVDEDGERILAGVHPLAELAPRDVVAHTVYVAAQNQRRVLLDATKLNCDVGRAFPFAHQRCLTHGFDLRHESVPVTPAAHYHMGGVSVDLDGRTSLPNLWAVGEAACSGVHGVNRLASNSLLEAVVFGRRLGCALTRDRPKAAPFSGAWSGDAARLPAQEGASRELREMMWRCMGVARSAATIALGLGFIARLREQTPEIMRLDHARLLLAEHMLLAAARRRTSCGSHFRNDDPERGVFAKAG